ncbi:mitochondrial glycoprotein [Multifurca ochricompacta]|uniref:Mitochondrial glycoprotein n=1 Tax=Multifurca ochricompacta TaxID=376703 RepID=A0AAD4QMG0_9AGAM|nr:mitochondrial glycoprotein [Multifurca ochricompacta]
MSLLRAVRQFSLPSSRSISLRSSLISTRARAPALSRITAATPAVRASFSVSACRFGEGTTDGDVSAKITEELAYEKEAAIEGEPEFLKEFKTSGIWTIEDAPGNDEVGIHRKFGNEHIRLIFSIADLQSAEENFEPPEGEEGASEDVEASYPLRCSFTITKPSVPGALSIDAVCQEGAFVVENVSFYSDSKLATDLTAEADWKRRGLYIGPQFETLDLSLQEEFEKFLQERGINESLAFFVPEYAQYKEQKEYVGWLNKVKKFIDA